MRHAPLVALTVLAAALAGCSKSGPNKQAEGQPTAAEQPAAPTMTDEEKAKALAALPAPYNAADFSNGEAKFTLCKSCHTTEAGGANMTGPNLHGIFGSKAAVVPGFKFSDPMKASGITWDAKTIDQWITKPSDMVPGTKMTFPGLSDPKDRTDVIAYLMVMTGYHP